MTFTDRLKEIQRELQFMGYISTIKPVKIDDLKKENTIQNCKIISKKDQYNILYMEAKSNWKGIATNVAKNQRKPCLVITSYGDSYLILSTVNGITTNTPKPRHLIIDQKSKSHSMQKFIKLIKTKANDDFISIDKKVQQAFDNFLEYKEAFAKFENNLGTIIEKTKTMIDKAIVDNEKYQIEAEKFLKICQQIINKNMKLKAVKDMLIQHILTYRIFKMVYDDQDFHSINNVAKSLEKLKELLNLSDKKINYDMIELVAESIVDSDQKQEFLKKLYETFYKKYDPATADRDGIVYTPSEIVNFMVKSADEIIQKHFGKTISDDGITILDPATGTGTFLVHILREMDKELLENKYMNELHANDIFILPYYIAALNIENTYKELIGEYREFKNICWIDTLNSRINDYEKITTYFNNDNVKRISKQQKIKINLMITNPPYSKGQKNYDQKNPNKKYREIDKRIKETYEKKLITKLGAAAKTALRDSYIRFIRWMSDEINKSGIIVLVTNSSFIRTEATAGMRASFVDEFNEIWCFDLRGNASLKGEIRKREGGGIFGSGSKSPIAITILIKNPKKNGCIIYYKDIGDYLTQKQKLEIIEKIQSIKGINDWQIIEPNIFNDWLDKRDPDFYRYTVSCSKIVKLGKKENSIFKTYSRGVTTSRDAWAYNSSKNSLIKNMKKHIDYCNEQDLNNFKTNPRYAKNTPNLIRRLKNTKFKNKKFDPNKIRIALYRPFFKQFMYFDAIYNESRGLIHNFFPRNNSKNLVISIPYKFTGDFYAFITDMTPDLEITRHGQCFPLYIYKDSTLHSNITMYAIQEYKKYYRDAKIQNEDIFYYVYGLFHHPEYCKKFANNLIRELPRIPMAPQFWKISKIGRQLAYIHLNFEICERYTLERKFQINNFKKLIFGRKKRKYENRVTTVDDETIIKADGKILFENIPEIKYRINGRTPVGWIIDCYKRKIDETNNIINDPCMGIDIIAMLERAVYIGLESDKLVEKLSKLEFEPKIKPPLPKEPKKSKPKSVKLRLKHQKKLIPGSAQTTFEL